MSPIRDAKMTNSLKFQSFPEYLKTLGRVELSETCEAVLAELRSREAEKIKLAAQMKLTEDKR